MFGIWKKAHGGIRRGWIAKEDAHYIVRMFTTKRWFLTERAVDIRVFETKDEAAGVMVEVIAENPTWTNHLVIREVPKGARKEGP